VHEASRFERSDGDLSTDGDVDVERGAWLVLSKLHRDAADDRVFDSGLGENANDTQQGRLLRLFHLAPQPMPPPVELERHVQGLHSWKDSTLRPRPDGRLRRSAKRDRTPNGSSIS
jgi:hypothetical protein